MPKITVVLPTYNGEKYIEESVHSILNQTYVDWELIIVDDCSSDRTGEVADHLAKTDSRIQVIHNDENEKLPTALNIGFRQAKGEYLTWTSDDNCYLTHAFEAMARFLDSNKEYAMVCTGMLWFDEKWNYIKEHPVYDETTMFLEDVVGASFMYRRKILKDIGEYSPDMFCVEDYEYWIRILESGNRIGYLDGTYYRYRLHQESLTVAKKEVVEKQQRRLYVRHLNWILKGINKDISSMMRVYGEIIKCEGIDFREQQMRFFKYLPLLQYDHRLPADAKFYLYGAGKMGRETLRKMKGKAEGFVDRDEAIIGNTVENVPVVSLEAILEKSKEDRSIYIIVSVGYEKQYEVIENLIANGIESYSVMGHVW